MQQLREDLWQTVVEQTEGVNACAFLLRRSEGNVLFYNTTHEADFDQIAQLGGVGHQVLSHRHEADPSNAVKARFGATVCSDAAEAPAIREENPVDLTFEQADGRLGSVEILHTPGHTEGGISCVYRSPHGGVYLFSGDTMIPVKGHWIAQFVPQHGGDADTLCASLLLLRDLAPDLVLSSSSIGDTVMDVEHEEWIRAVEETAGRQPIRSE